MFHLRRCLVWSVSFLCSLKQQMYLEIETYLKEVSKLIIADTTPTYNSRTQNLGCVT